MKSLTVANTLIMYRSAKFKDTWATNLWKIDTIIKDFVQNFPI